MGQALRGILLILGLAVALAAGAILYSLLTREAVTEKPATLRVYTGKVYLRGIAAVGWVEAKDLDQLPPGYQLRVPEGARALVQHFEGSIVLLDGPAAIEIDHSVQYKAGQEAYYAVEQAVIQGKVVIWVTPLSSPLSSFRVRTPGSVAAVQGTIFEVTVDDLGGAQWKVAQGEVKLAALVVTNEQRYAAYLTPVKEGEVVWVPPPPKELIAQAAAMEKVTSLLTQLAEKSVKEQKTEVQVAGAQIAGINLITNSAVYNLVVPQAPPPPPPTPAPVVALQEGLVAKKDELAERLGIPVAVAVSTKPLTEGLPPIPILPSTGAAAPVSPPKSRGLLVGVVQPLGVAVSPDGRRIYVTESEGRRLTWVFDSRGDPIGVLEPPDSFPLNRRPVYVAVDREGKVYVSDRVRHTIDIYGPDGAYIGRFAPNGNPDFDWSPLALTFGPQGNLYVTDLTPGYHRVMVFNPQGQLLFSFGREGNRVGEFAFPNGIAVDSQGKIYVADSNNVRLQIFYRDGKAFGQVDTRAVALGLPRGLAVDGEGRLYVVDSFGHKVLAFRTGQSLELLFSFGEEGSGEGKFSFPNGIAVQPGGLLYVTDRANDRVQLWGY